jgi:hypothetical protein
MRPSASSNFARARRSGRERVPGRISWRGVRAGGAPPPGAPPRAPPRRNGWVARVTPVHVISATWHQPERRGTPFSGLAKVDVESSNLLSAQAIVRRALAGSSAERSWILRSPESGALCVFGRALGHQPSCDERASRLGDAGARKVRALARGGGRPLPSRNHGRPAIPGSRRPCLGRPGGPRPRGLATRHDRRAHRRQCRSRVAVKQRLSVRPIPRRPGALSSPRPPTPPPCSHPPPPSAIETASSAQSRARASAAPPSIPRASA